MIVAVLALVVATGGTAVAQGILIRNSAQIADGVVTGSQARHQLRAAATPSPRTRCFRNDIGDRAITNRELSNPIFTAAVDSDGTVSSAQSVGVDQSLTRKIDQVGGGVIYDVGFQPGRLAVRLQRHARPDAPRRQPLTGVPRPRVARQQPADRHRLRARQEGSFFQPARPSSTSSWLLRTLRPSTAAGRLIDSAAWNRSSCAGRGPGLRPRRDARRVQGRRARDRRRLLRVRVVGRAWRRTAPGRTTTTPTRRSSSSPRAR